MGLSWWAGIWLLDRGFQVFNTSYPQVKRRHNLAAVQLCPFTPGVLLQAGDRRLRLADPTRRLNGVADMLRGRLAGPADALALARLSAADMVLPAALIKRQPDRTTSAALRKAGISPALCELLWRPFLSGVLLEDELQTSSRFFHLGWRSMLRGTLCLPRRGIQAVPEQLAEGLPAGTVRLETPVSTLTADGVRLADGAASAQPGHPGEPRPLRLRRSPGHRVGAGDDGIRRPGRPRAPGRPRLLAGRGAARTQYIGIDDGKPRREPGLVSSEADQAEEFAELFRAVYLTFHRRDGPRSPLPGASAGVLEHLVLAGPLTIGETASHLRRAQSVVSEIVTHLERQGLLEREADPADRRRTLIWLTAAGHAALRRHREVLSEDLLAGALSRLDPQRAAAMLTGLRALVQSAAPPPLPAEITEGTHHD